MSQTTDAIIDEHLLGTLSPDDLNVVESVVKTQLGF